jgi:hypothetical protein
MDISNSKLMDINLTTRLDQIEPTVLNLNDITTQHTSAITDISNNKAPLELVNNIENKVIKISYDENNLATTILNTCNLDDANINYLDVSTNLNINGSCRISNIDYEITDLQFKYLSSIESDYNASINSIISNILNQDISINNIKTSLNTLSVSDISINTLLQLTNDNISVINSSNSYLQNVTSDMITNISGIKT